jgi:hypothetical protein
MVTLVWSVWQVWHELLRGRSEADPLRPQLQRGRTPHLSRRGLQSSSPGAQRGLLHSGTGNLVSSQ